MLDVKTQSETTSESGQTLMEALLWIVLLSSLGLGFSNLSQIDYVSYKTLLKNHDSRSGDGHLRSRSFSRPALTKAAGKKGESDG
jgi:hypothetical protein